MAIEISVGEDAKREVMPAITKGLKCKCPNCGDGKQFKSFLKVVDECDSCGTELHHHRADDFPPYLTIFIVGHVIITLVMIVEARTDWSTIMHLAVWVPLTIAMSLAILQPLKGAVVGLQWALRMHGFGGGDDSTL